MKSRPALTMIELLLVMSIMAVLMTGGLLIYSGSQKKYALKLSGDALVSNLQRAHIYSREQKDNKTWGIEIVDDKNYQLVSRDATAEIVKFRYKLTDPVVFEGATREIWFDQATGNLSENMTVVLTVSEGGNLTVNISKFGVVSTQ